MKQRITSLKRRQVLAAFRRMARGVEERAAYGRTIGFYRASGQAWAERLG
jgi:hypothetical protein